ncbi:MAG: hypothetical protein CMC13_00390 [Flavobacteriaceae bacterium]|nr:hypothetical protein [Flavobacteriaceae bacterium]|tara:strand:+ start:30558 stop:31058 length:501 start_codon:yes stop_codon:yes gene_type:complete
MSELTKKEKVNIILKEAKKHSITAYEFGQNTSISILAARKILLQETKNPSHRTLNEMLNYIENKIVGKDIPGEKNYLKERVIKNHNAAEEESTYKNGTAEVLSAIDQLQKMVRRDNDLMAKALEISLLDTQEIKSLSSLISDKTDTINSSIEGLSTVINKRLGSGS